MTTQDNLYALFPKLPGSGSITSPFSRSYNCVAWIIGDQDRWWEPSDPPTPGLYWPDDLPRTPDRAAYVALFERWGFSSCSSGELEAGVEKIAIWFDGGIFKHVALQLENGWWTSKLGWFHDVSHGTLDAITGDQEREITGDPIFMARPRERSHPLAGGAVDLASSRVVEQLPLDIPNDAD